MSAAPDPGAKGHPRLVRFRAMTPGDLAGVAAVERASYQFPWSEGIFRDCLRVGYLCRVADLDGEIVAYGVVAMGAGEAPILHLCVRAELRGRSLGRQMLLLLLVLMWAGLGLTIMYRRLTVRYRLTNYRFFHDTGLLTWEGGSVE